MAAGEERTLSFEEIAGALRLRGIYLNLLPYFLVLIPLVVLLNLLALRVDEHFGLSPVLEPPARAVLFILFTCAGLAVVWWSYAYLGILGEGSPSPHLGGTRFLVRDGPYSAVRHPSVVGKLLGVLGAGFLFGSPTFLGALLPLLLAGSLVYNRFYQEELCIRQFGDDYREYRKRVPLLVPSPRQAARLLQAPGTRQWLGAWLLVSVLLLQLLQLWWLTASRERERFVWVPLSFTAEGAGQVPSAPLVSGPAVLGPTLTLEDVVRGLLVMDEHPELGLALDPSQRRTLARILRGASQERDEMLSRAAELREAEAREADLMSRMLAPLTEEQRRYLRDHGALDADASVSPPWEPLLRALSRGAEER